MIPPRFQPLTTDRAGRAAREASIQFVVSLWDYDPEAYTFIGTKCGDRWRDHPITGDREAALANIFAAYPADRYDLYFCPNAFAEPRRQTHHALRTRRAWCDIDRADPAGYDPAPNILWETSPSRFQGIWTWRDAVEGAEAERYSQAIVMKDGGDRGGWSVTKMLRVPGSINHKPDYARPLVTLRAYDGRPQRLPASLKALAEHPTVRHSANGLPASGDDARTIMRRYRRRMGLPAGALMTARRVLRADRSAAVFQIVAGLIDAGAPDGDIMVVLLDNPHFLDKWGYDPAKADDEVVRIRARIGGAR
jgi:hypothetical protein